MYLDLHWRREWTRPVEKGTSYDVVLDGRQLDRFVVANSSNWTWNGDLIEFNCLSLLDACKPENAEVRKLKYTLVLPVDDDQHSYTMH